MSTVEPVFIGLSAIWCALAVFYAGEKLRIDAHLPRRVTSLVFIALPLLAVVLLPLPAATAATGLMLLAAFVWFARLQPEDIGGWETEYARMPRVTRDGNLVHVTDVRDFRYLTVEDVVPAYYDATYDLDRLTGVDLICSYWAGRHIAHVFLSFAFLDGRHVAVSVETRRRRNQAYSTVAGFFRHYQLIFVVADERDLIGVRTDTRREDVYLYRLRTTPEERRRLFGGYMDRVAKLSEQPEFYHTVFNNCTSNIVSVIDGGLPKDQQLGMDWRLLFSGHADEFAYSIGRLKTRLPFAELKRASRIARPDGATIDESYSASIRSPAVQATAEERSGASATRLTAAATDR